MTDPQLAAMAKIRKMQRKKDSKKRKMHTQRNPNKTFKKRKQDLDNDDF
jgi:hypothetical protein